ncbi:MAG: hypothetical protein U0269_20490 [Polyangiales bacterium]
MKRKLEDPPSPQNDPRFQRERREFGFVVGCERCTYFVERTGECAHRYPNAAHREGAFDEGAQPAGSFCKEFELA